MSLRIFRIGKLPGQKRVHFSGKRFGFPNASEDSTFLGGEMDISPVAANHQHPLVAHSLRKNRNESKTQLSTDQRHRDASRSAGGFDHRAARFQTSLVEGVAEDVARNSILCGTTWIEEVELAPYHGSIRRQLNGDERRHRKIGWISIVRVEVLFQNGSSFPIRLP